MVDKNNGEVKTEDAREQTASGSSPCGPLAAGASGHQPEDTQKHTTNPGDKHTKSDRLRRSIFSSTFWTAFASVVIAITTIVYTHYASRQFGVLEKQLEADQRPWVYIRQFQYSQDRLSDVEPTVIKAIVVNGGKTPAVIDRAIFGYYKGAVFPDDPQQLNSIPGVVLFPGATYEMAVAFRVTSDELSMAQRKEIGLYVYGTFLYRNTGKDPNPNIHTTKTCFWLASTNPLVFQGCGKYNYAD